MSESYSVPENHELYGKIYDIHRRSLPNQPEESEYGSDSSRALFEVDALDGFRQSIVSRSTV